MSTIDPFDGCLCYAQGIKDHWMKKLFALVTALLFVPFRPSVSQVLHLVNQARVSLNLPPLDALPPGTKGRSVACPLSRALGGRVGVDGICFDERTAAYCVADAWQTSIINRGYERYVVHLPLPLKHFVRDFDLGAYYRLA